MLEEPGRGIIRTIFQYPVIFTTWAPKWLHAWKICLSYSPAGQAGVGEFSVGKRGALGRSPALDSKVLKHIIQNLTELVTWAKCKI
jgi:hypothetical protein